jgi:glycerol kinase
VTDAGPVVLSIDQGTSSTKAVAVAEDGSFLAKQTIPVAQRHDRPGWVEQDATEIFTSVATALTRLARDLATPAMSLGLSTQRESAVLWERRTGEPLGPMLGWQDRRTTAAARAHLDAGAADRVRAITGLPIDPMFSALKFGWLLDTADPDRRRARAGELAVGTVDSYLTSRLTGRHQIEAGNASRTLLMDLDDATWSAEMLDLFGIPETVLPEIVPSNARTPVLAEFGLGGIGIDAVLGDSHAALYGHGARAPGDVKVTYGTGSSIMGLLPAGATVGEELARTVAWKLDDHLELAFEGNILSSGATLVWLSEVLQTAPGQLIEMAAAVHPLHGVNLVPAFAGLAAPWWSETAEASLSGFTLGTPRDVIARAATDSIALQVEDVLAAAERAGVRVDTVLLDGGPSANDWLVQLQSDLSQRIVRRSSVPELSALGAAQLAATTAGRPIRASNLASGSDTFTPRLPAGMAADRRLGWSRAVERVLGGTAHDTSNDHVVSTRRRSKE